MSDSAFKVSSGKYTFRGDSHTALVSLASIRYFPWRGSNKDEYNGSFRNSMAFSFHSVSCRDISPKETLHGWKLEHNSTQLAFFMSLSLKKCTFLVGKHLVQDHQLLLCPAVRCGTPRIGPNGRRPKFPNKKITKLGRAFNNIQV